MHVFNNIKMGGGMSRHLDDAQTTSKKNTDIVILRAIAILVVVLGHSIIIFDYNWSSAYGYSHICKSEFFSGLKQIINMFQMELFFSISGFCLFYSRRKSISFLAFTKGKITRLLIPFIFTALMWLIPIRLAVDYPKYTDLHLFHILYRIMTLQDAGHLWFLPVLFSIFILSYPLLLLDRINRYLPIIVALLLFSIYPVFRNPLLRHTFHYLFFFLLGYLINSLGVFNVSRTLKAFIFVGFIVTSVIGFYIIPETMGNKWYAMAMSVLIVIILYIFINHIPFNRVWSEIDRNSFGIYLFHSPILYIGMTYLTFLPPIIFVIVQFCFSIVISWFIVEILRRTRLRFFIGEK